jgi:hypothetical protein
LEGKAGLAREKAKIGSLDGGRRRSASHSIAAERGALNRRDAKKTVQYRRRDCHLIVSVIAGGVD